MERANLQRLRKLRTPIRYFDATDGGVISDLGRRDKVLAHVAVPKQLVLRTGAQVSDARSSLFILPLVISFILGHVGEEYGQVLGEWQCWVCCRIRVLGF